MIVALIGPAAAVLLSQHWTPRSELIQSLRDIRPSERTGYAMETTKAAPDRTPIPSTPVTVDLTASPPPRTQGGEARPVEYSFPLGQVTITSVPSGAEILHGSVPLGFTPLTVDLPPGEQTLTARLKNYPDRSQNVTVDENATSTIAFEMRMRRRIAKAKPTPPPSLLQKVGGSLKHLFGPSPTPSRRKR